MKKRELKQMIDRCYEEAAKMSNKYIEIIETATNMMLGWLLSEIDLFDEFMKLEEKKQKEIKTRLWIK